MEKIPPIGEILSPILHEISETLREHEATLATKPEYNMAGFQAATHIFTSAMLDFAFDFLAITGKNSDLEWHIDAKMRYNELRPFRNGKQY